MLNCLVIAQQRLIGLALKTKRGKWGKNKFWSRIGVSTNTFTNRRKTEILNRRLRDFITSISLFIFNFSETVLELEGAAAATAKN